MRKSIEQNRRSLVSRVIMPMMRNMAIRHKLVMVIMLTSLVALLLAGVTFVSYQRLDTRRAMVKSLRTEVEMIADNCQAAMSFADKQDAEKTLKAFKAESSIVYACIRDKEGAVFVEYRRDGAHVTVPLLESRQEDGYRFSDELLSVSRSIISDGEKVGSVSVWSDLEPLRVMFRRNLAIMWTVLTLAALAAYLLSYRVQGVISSPILDLASVARTVSEKQEYSTRAAKMGNDEVGFLIDSFNAMLGQIQQRDQALVAANEQLEARVDERTAELSETNEQLKAEIDQRQRTEEALRQRSERVIRHQAALLKLGTITEVETESVFRTITEEVAKTLEVERVSIWLFDQTQTDLVCEDLYKSGPKTHEDGQRLPAARYPRYLQVLDASRILAVEDVTKDTRASEFAHGYCDTLDIRSMMDIPIRLHGKLVGVICHEQVGEGRPWSLEEQDFAASVADGVTLKLEAVERRKAQQALRESEHRYRTLLKNIPQKIFYKDLGCAYLLCNESYAQELKLDPDQIRGKTDYDFHPTEMADKYRADDQRIMASGEPEEIEEIYVCDGKEMIVQTLKSPVRDEDGNTIGIFAIFWDITARKQAEKALDELNRDLQTTVQELRRSNKELQDFAYVTAHDLKAPLRAIGTLSDWVYGDNIDRLDEQGREHLQLIKRRVSRMNGLIDSILRYSEIGRGNRNIQKVNLNVVVTEAIAAIDPPKHIEIIADGELPSILCERVSLTQIFQNLIGNAVRFMDKPEGHIEIGCKEQDDFWTFFVADNGPGIEQRYFDRIFKMFQTLTPRDELESTGIGLTVVKKIVELYGGRVWVESIVGEGSTFFFSLPKQAAHVESDRFQAVIGVRK